MGTINIRVIERWLNKTINDAENLNIPTAVMKQEVRDPLFRYHIARNNLSNLGVSNKEVDSIYRSLFAHSVGYFDMLRMNLVNVESKQKTQILKGLWKVYVILLEYCCRTEYMFTIE